ncbi:hypothetical protein M433DRAFT_454064 [Acidomyces richmondensis BFW]|nr:hypothetical protein M433DRAFT_454064 [Acidomyces richmondensis BFW]
MKTSGSKMQSSCAVSHKRSRAFGGWQRHGQKIRQPRECSACRHSRTTLGAGQVCDRSCRTSGRFRVFRNLGRCLDRQRRKMGVSHPGIGELVPQLFQASRSL